MIVLLFCFFVVFSISVIYGRVAQLAFDPNRHEDYSFFSLFFIGLCFVGTLLNFISLFFPITVYTLLVVVVSGIVMVYKDFSFYKETITKPKISLFFKDKRFRIVLIALLFFTLIVSVIVPQNYDSYLYHINAIQWIENYRAVPGLANLHDRFGLNSSIFTLSACFSFYELYNQYIFPLNSLAYFIFCTWILKHIFASSKSKSILLFVFFFYFTKQYLADISSPGTDLLPNIFISFLILQIIIDPQAISKKYVLFLSVSLFCITLKISSIPIVLLGFLSLQLSGFSWFKKIRLFIIIGILMMVPWLIRNVILTGYLIYPFEQLDLFNFDWKMKAESVTSIREWITSWARIPEKSKTEVLSLTYTEWIKHWWTLMSGTNRVIFILALLSPITWLFLHFNSYYKRMYDQLNWVVFTLFAGFLFWFFTAPDFRFSFAFVLLLAVLPILLLEPLFEKFNLLSKITLGILIFSGFVIIYQDGYQKFKSEYRSLANVKKYIYLQNDVYEVKFKKRIQFKSIQIPTKNRDYLLIYYPAIERSQCFDQFPCTWFYLDNFEFRGNSFQEGFKAK